MPRENSNGKPDIIIILSGKRKCGKDYVANILLERYGKDDAVILRLSGPLKERYALENNLNYEKLLDSSEYKEIFREKMIKWGEAIRNQDPGYFCRHAIQQSCAKSKRIWIVSDARRKTDIEFFKTNYPDETYTVRINASDVVRQKRGWNYAKGVDDCESECGLDDYNQWNLEIYNDNDEQMLEGIQKVFLSTKINVK
ncbi:phosphomevalonate kinase-like [Argiope bruennichi]|uniref:phosphomevalonate kinase-like n=1 Tax=Argiope bruennichi TaxID=94029 RepID=UPI0024958E32|nr:phosphomevalonate kinase-like [Argiope bruennichi]